MSFTFNFRLENQFLWCKSSLFSDEIWPVSHTDKFTVTSNNVLGRFVSKIRNFLHKIRVSKCRNIANHRHKILALSLKFTFLTNMLLFNPIGCQCKQNNFMSTWVLLNRSIYYVQSYSQSAKERTICQRAWPLRHVTPLNSQGEVKLTQREELK